MLDAREGGARVRIVRVKIATLVRHDPVFIVVLPS
jgi:hypothetical protein